MFKRVIPDPLPSAGVARPPRYYGPLRHPERPGLTLAGCRLARATPPPRLPVLRPSPSSMRAAANTPAERAGACVARFPARGSLPRVAGGSASALQVSGPARRSLALRPAWSLSRQRGPLASKCFSRCRCLHRPLRLLPAGATVAGRDSHPLRDGAFTAHRHRLIAAGRNTYCFSCVTTVTRALNRPTVVGRKVLYHTPMFRSHRLLWTRICQTFFDQKIQRPTHR